MLIERNLHFGFLMLLRDKYFFHHITVVQLYGFSVHCIERPPWRQNDNNTPSEEPGHDQATDKIGTPKYLERLYGACNPKIAGF